MLIIVRLIRTEQFSVVLSELLLVGALLFTLLMLTTPLHERLRSMRGLYRMLICVVLFQAITLPIVYQRVQDPELWGRFIAAYPEIFGGAGGADLVNNPQLPPLILSISRLICGMYGGLYMMIPVGSWATIQMMRVISPRLFRTTAAARAAAAATTTPTLPLYPLEKFRLPHNTVYVFIGAITAMILFRIINDQSILFYAATNTVLVTALLYTMQGLSLVMRVWMRRHPRVQAIRGLLIMSLLTLIIPVLNFILLGVMCGVGVSRTWFDYDYLITQSSIDDNE